jgi:hypothetical protein
LQVTTVVEIEIQEDGSMVAVAERDWKETLLDACSVRLLGQVADEGITWDIYEARHVDCQVRTYALEADTLVNAQEPVRDWLAACHPAAEGSQSVRPTRDCGEGDPDGE